MQNKKLYILLSGILVLTHINVFSQGEEQVTRKANYKVDDMIINRSSSYALSGESISDEELNSLFEAARWAQSSANKQPWHFIYAKRDTKSWNKLFNLMIPFNQSWAKNAGVLIVVVSKNTFDFNGEFARTHSFDTGAASQNLALQGVKNGLVVHGMEGFDYDKAKRELNIPDGYSVEAMFAVGKPGSIDNLPEELQKRTRNKSTRKSIKDFAFEGEFKAS